MLIPKFFTKGIFKFRALKTLKYNRINSKLNHHYPEEKDYENLVKMNYYRLMNFRKKHPIKFLIGLITVTALLWPFLTIIFIYEKKKIKTAFDKNIKNFFTSNEIKSALKEWIIHIFNDKKVLNPLVAGIVAGLKKEEFLDEVKIWSKIWVLAIIKNKEFIKNAKIASVKIVKTDSIKDVGATLMKDIVTSDETKDTVADVMKDIWLNPYVFDLMISQFSKSGIHTIQNVFVLEKLSDVIKEVTQDPELTQFFMHTILKLEKKPVLRFQFTFPEKDFNPILNSFDGLLISQNDHKILGK